MSLVGIIGGTGLTRLENLQLTETQTIETPFGFPSSDLAFGKLAGQDVVFLARHGSQHTIPPHKVNYRANIWSLKQAGVKHIIAVAAVGGISERMMPESIVIPDQVIDYTYGRSQTFFEDNLEFVTHIDFSYPYNARLRDILLSKARQLAIPAIDGGTYAATQGPRLESAAEIMKLERDGCDIVGMTGMPETALARELEMDYVACALVVNWGAGKNQGGEISLQEMEKCLESGMARVRHLLESVIPSISVE